MQSNAALSIGSNEWHAERRLGIGGSDAAPALGMSKWKTPFQLYEEKLGLAEAQDETWPMMLGNAVEPILRQHFANTTGLEVRLPTAAIVHPKYEWMRYNPDGLCDGKILAEYKTAAYGKEWGEVGTDEIPQEYILQVQHGLACLDYEVAKCAVSIAGREPKYYEVEADHGLQEMIIEGEHEFWQKVKKGIPPDPINNEDCSRIFSRVNGQSVIITPEIEAALIDLKAIRAGLKAIESDKEALEVVIKTFMAENEILVNDNMVPLITWKQAAGAKRIDTDALRTNFPEVAAQVTKVGDNTRRFLVK